MEETKVLILEFKDADGNTVSFTVKDPKEDLTMEDVVGNGEGDGAMEKIVAAGALLGKNGAALAECVTAYYKTVTLENLTSSEAE